MSGATPLYAATQENSIEAVIAHLQARTEVDKAVANGASPLYAAAQGTVSRLSVPSCRPEQK